MSVDKRSRKITVRFTPNEFEKISAQFRKSTCKELSAYFRSVLIHRKLTMHYRNQSLDDLIEEFKCLRRELNALGNNFNQIVKKLNVCQKNQDIIYYTDLATAHQQKLLEMVEYIKSKIGDISDLWLQKL